MKPTIGIFSFSSCSGCQLEIIHQEDILLDLMSKVRVVYFPMLQERNELAKIDVAVVEGSISTEKHIEAIKKIRELSSYVVAIGACATHGGINSIRNPLDMKSVDRYVYGKESPVPSVSSHGIDKYVKVDYYLRGCPPVKEEFTRVLKSLLLQSRPFVYNQPVCSECRIRENLCLLQHGSICLGPITYGGCGALCPTNNLGCDGCRGQFEDGNRKALADCLEANGIGKKQMEELVAMFNTAGVVLK
jgi:sulfhydrogenase subunit delta